MILWCLRSALVHVCLFFLAYLLFTELCLLSLHSFFQFGGSWLVFATFASCFFSTSGLVLPFSFKLLVHTVKSDFSNWRRKKMHICEIILNCLNCTFSQLFGWLASWNIKCLSFAHPRPVHQRLVSSLFAKHRKNNEYTNR